MYRILTLDSVSSLCDTLGREYVIRHFLVLPGNKDPKLRPNGQSRRKTLNVEFKDQKKIRIPDWIRKCSYHL